MLLQPPQGDIFPFYFFMHVFRFRLPWKLYVKISSECRQRRHSGKIHGLRHTDTLSTVWDILSLILKFIWNFYVFTTQVSYDQYIVR